ncbi:MAG: ribokinase [Actinomycetaceae bacterium]|nr:ribokinase [Actinomycetaceae bacterium]
MSVAVFGSLNVDLNLTTRKHPRPGETVLGGGGITSAGGKGANQALAAALAGATTTMIGKVGEDTNAEIALASLRKAGVNLHHVQTSTEPTGLAVVTVAENGENTIIVVPGANGDMDASNLEWAKAALKSADVLVMQAEVPLECVLEMTKAAQESGIRTIFNLAPALEIDPVVLRQANPLVVNEHEARTALRCLKNISDAVGAADDDAMNANENVGGGVDDSDAHEDDAKFADKTNPTDYSEEEAIVRELLCEGVPSVVATLGAAGAILGWRQNQNGSETIVTEHVPAAPTQAIDTVGAGDAFVGVLAAHLGQGKTLQESAQKATRFAAETVKHVGAQDSYWKVHQGMKGK